MATRVVMALTAFLLYFGSHIPSDLTFNALASVPVNVWIIGLAEGLLAFSSPSLISKGMEKTKEWVK